MFKKLKIMGLSLILSVGVFGCSKTDTKVEDDTFKVTLVLDEGGGIMNNAFPGVKGDVAFLAVVEKGMVNVKLTLEGNGGHSSTPRKNGPVVRMSKAITKLEKHPMKPQYTKTIKLS